MKKNSLILLLCLIFSVGYSQNTTLSGEVSSGNLEGVSIESIHVINKSQKIFTTTDASGTFEIEAKAGDTIVFSAIQYKLETALITLEHITSRTLKVIMEEHVNELPEAIIGFTLTGDLTKDVSNSDAKPTINFYDVGIPGYKGKPKTKSERLLQEASDLSPTAGGSLGGLGGSVSAIALINAISGRTKELKKRVALEANDVLMYAIKGRLSETFFKNNPLKETLRMDFFYFCAEDENFTKRCQDSDLEALDFMKEKYEAYKKNIKSQE